MIGQSVSSVEYLHAGVPQGAILCPLLFSLYMNDITAFTKGDVNLFADDTSAFTVSDSVADLQCSLQTVADELSSWFSNWVFVLRKKGSKTKERMKEEEIEKGDCGPPTFLIGH